MKNNIAVAFINSNNLIGLKAGKARASFLEIWMVTIDNRIFARSWGFAEKSWYATFLNDKLGQIKCGDNIFQIEAKIPTDLEDIKDKMNNQYLEKYDHGDNSIYAHGIIQEAHIAKTMEFVVVE